MLSGLGHHPFIGCDDHHHDIDAGGAGHHVFYELLVTRHIHDAQVLSAGKIQGRKSKLDGDAALLFLLQPVGVGTGNGLDQGGFPMIDVTCRAQYDLFQGVGSCLLE